MSTSPIPGFELRDYYVSASSAIRERFHATADGLAAVRERAALVDELLLRLWRSRIAPEGSLPERLCLVALGGYGRATLFPQSDIDLLFLCQDAPSEQKWGPHIKQFSQELWDVRLKLSPTTRTLAECDRVSQDNLEFTMSLLDCRYLLGDKRLFQRLHDEIIPRLVAREGEQIVRNLVDLTASRHASYGGTIFHLEPNLKDGPGGLRDYNVAAWLSLISSLVKQRRWPLVEPGTADSAFEFLCACRCFLHYRAGRDQNVLDYEAQPEAAAAGIGNQRGRLSASQLMRLYFRHARSIFRSVTQARDEFLPERSSLYRSFENWRSRLSNAEFSVVDERIFLRRPAALQDPSMVLTLLEFMARHGLKITGDTERRLSESSSNPAWENFPGLWDRLRQILVLPHAANALRAMHDAGLLVRLIPEFEAVDALVIRDYFHCYTVDEHSFTAIQVLHGLRNKKDEPEHRFSELLAELEQPELIFLALLLHDVGKGMPGDDHISGSLRALDPVMQRLGLEPEAIETVRFLISAHLDMSATLQRRDIFDPETVRSFTDKVSTPERLKMLCLLTYADITAVNPDALPVWKAENLWLLYAAASNEFDRSVDEQRLHAESLHSERAERVHVLLPRDVTREELDRFLEGFPRRYLFTHSPAGIAAHFQMAAALPRERVQLHLERRRGLFYLTVVTMDTPGLFATIAGTLSAWGMNIVKADAFADSAGIILDTFQFTDGFRTLELNPQETTRFERSLCDVVTGEASLEKLMQGRRKTSGQRPAKLKVRTQLRFNDDASSHSTLLEIITQDRTGLLYDISSVIAEFGLNIEVALIDTEGQKVIDVFYLTSAGGKLTASQQKDLSEALLEEL